MKAISKVGLFMKATRKCPISFSDDVEIITERDRHGNKLTNVISKLSGLIFVDPVPFENTEDFYTNQYRENYKGITVPKPKHVYRAGVLAVRRLELIKPYLNEECRVLDAASSSGEFVYVLQKNGYKAQGVEANRGYADYSIEELELNIKNSPFSQFDSAQKFDAITMFHALEHLENPTKDLAHLKSYLSEGGIFIIEVPNILYPNMAFKNKWHSGHLFSYTVETLTALFIGLGFEVLRCENIDNGGNVFGVFRKQPPITGTENEIKSTVTNYKHIISKLKKDQRLYWTKPHNYFKFINKAVKSLREKKESKNKSPKEILDHVIAKQREAMNHH